MILVEQILQGLVTRGICDIHANYLLKRHDEELFNRLGSLGITHVYCFHLPGTGKVHLGIPGSGGVVSDHGDSVPEWVGELLCNPQHKDVLDKLDKSNAPECHVFVIVDYGGTSWPIFSYLSNDIKHLPRKDPNLPFPVTGVWIASLFGHQGVRWDGSKWRLFQTYNVNREN
ncbi:MAG: hypothetical protein IBX69_16450 [Anaerolineales bacterium]|nr:hypothetical protein [Anaerolineales bacterium]